MSHHNHHQVFGATGSGAAYPPPLQQQQQSDVRRNVVVPQQQQQLGGQQPELLNPQMQQHMDTLAQQRYEAWQQYYSQIGAAQPQQLPLMGVAQPVVQTPLNAYQTVMTQQPQQQQPSANVGPTAANIGGMIHQQTQPHQQLLFSQQQPILPSVGTYNTAAAGAAASSVSELASLAAHQQYLLLAQQQQQYLQQKQQQQQQQQQQFIVKQYQQQLQQQQQTPQPPQQQQLPPLGLPVMHNMASTSSTPIPAAPIAQVAASPSHPPMQQQQKQHQQQQQQQQRSHSRTQPTSVERAPPLKSPLPLKSPPQQQQARIKTPEDARLLAQRELEAQAERTAQKEAKQSQLVEEELKRKQHNVQEHAKAVQEKLQSIPEPIHLAGCHTLSKVSAFLPFPAEIPSTSSTLQCFDQQQAQLVLSNQDTMLADYLGTLMSDTTDQLRKIILKHEEEESTDLADICPMPALIQAVQSMSQFAFSIEQEPFEDDEEEEDVLLGGEAGQLMSAEVNSLADAVLNDVRSGGTAADESMMAAQQQLPSSQKESEMRRQMVSVGKQPKVGSTTTTTTRRKKDMVESLYDSLTGYFDSKGQRRRIRPNKQSGTDDDDQTSTTSNERGSEEPSSEAAGNDGEKGAKQAKSRKRRKPSNDREEDGATARPSKVPPRPPTPTEVIKQRELEWNERQKQREEKYKRRQQSTSSSHTHSGGGVGHQHQQHQQQQEWNTDMVSENESFCRFSALVDQVLEQMDEAMSSMPSTMNSCGGAEESDVLLERGLLDELRIEAQKLKAWQKLSEISVERLCKLLSIMEKNIRDVLSEEGELSVLSKGFEEDESDETLRELIDDRLLRAIDAALVSMCIMTSKRMPKQVLMEDIIERSIQLCKQCLQEVVYPAVDSTQSSKAKNFPRKGMDNMNMSISKRKRHANKLLYGRLVDLMGCFSELTRFQTLNETLLIQLSSLGTPAFFVDNVPEVQMESIKLLPIIFSKCPAQRKTLLFELLNSVHRLPLNRNIRNTYRLSAHESIGNFTVLVLQLVQSTVQLPSRKSHHHHHHAQHDSKKLAAEELNDRLVLDSFEEAKKMAAFFLGGFLAKCTAKAEDDYRRLFEQFLQDILMALYRPMWPVAEMMLTVLGNLLVMHFRSKTFDLSLRVAALDYLGIIAARLRKDRLHALAADATEQEKARLNSIVKSILFDEYSYDPSYNVEDIDIGHLSQSEKVRKLEQALFDYIIGTMYDGDVSVEYVLLFYAVEWYRETVLDVEVVKERVTKAIAKGEQSTKERQKNEQRMLRIAEKGQSMKLFILGLMDKQHLKRRVQIIAKNGNMLIENDALWVVKYLASKKELTQSFDIYLRKILEGFNPELYPVAIRAKAMKCLAQIVEADYQVLMIPEVNKIVQDRLIDANASVREATFDLIGKCLVSKPELLDTYYSILVNRTKDTAIAVRKRVIRILRDIVFCRHAQQNFDRIPQLLSEIVQRVNDEETVKKLCVETFQQLWMHQIPDKAKLDAKINLLVETAKYCVTENSIEHLETLISLLVKNNQEPGTLLAAKQIVDSLVDYVLTLEKSVVHEQKSDCDLVDTTKNFQARQYATLSTLSFFATARPELLIRHIQVFVPYLSVSNASTLESRVVNQIITMLEQVIPLMEGYGTSQSLVRQLDTQLNEIAKDGGMLLIASAISCMSAVHAKFQQEEQPSVCRLFIVYYKYLEKCKREMDRDQLSADKKPNLCRAVYSIGLMCRYFDFDTLLSPSQKEVLQMCAAETINGGGTGDCWSTTKENQQSGSGSGIGLVFSLLFYFSRSSDPAISQKALIAVGQIAAGHPELLRRDELKSMYMVLLNAKERNYLQLKVQVLKNIACFLHAEEQRAMGRAELAKKEREQLARQQEEDSLMMESPDEQSQPAAPGGPADDLKEMELGSAGLSSSIIQQYWHAILNCYFHEDEMVRLNSAQVIRQTLEQGLVTPGSSVPTLVAMSTDTLSTIRTRVETLIRDMNTKYKGLILSKAVAGVRLAFQLQKKIRANPSQIIRGIRANENPVGSSSSGGTTAEKKFPSMSVDAQALLAIFYINVRTNRQNRRSFLSSLLKVFSEEHKEQKVEREEWLFIADNLAHFPYTVMDEPLYVIHQANAIISLSGQNILSQFRQLLVPSASGGNILLPTSSLDGTPVKRRLLGAELSSRSSTTTSSSLLNTTDELEEFSVEYIIEHLPEDRAHIQELKRNSQACFLLLHLRTFLMRQYGLKEDKVLEYSPSEAAQVYERPVNRRSVPVFSPDFLLNELGAGQQQVQQMSVTEENRKIAEDFHKFHEMLLSLEERRDEEEDGMSSTSGNNIVPIEDISLVEEQQQQQLAAA